MKPKHRRGPGPTRPLLIAGVVSFVIAVAAVTAIVWRLGDAVGSDSRGRGVTGPPGLIERWGTELEAEVSVEPAPLEADITIAEEPVAPASSTVPTIGTDPIAMLRRRLLRVPVEGTASDELRDSFDERRGAGRRHEAIDILAPRNTPVVAADAGTIARLFYSQAGGITIYQLDATEEFIFYYAHLERYAAGLKEGSPVRRGQVIGYVGTTGNAPPNTPHLHFAIFKTTAEKQWWKGTPIDPFQVLR